MKLTKLGVIALGCLGFNMAAQANDVLLTANKPVNITYRVAHQNRGGQPVFGELQTLNVSKSINIPVDLNNYDYAGLVIVSGNGHRLPSSANQFDQPEQCSMTTDKSKATGALAFTSTPHDLSCATYGGIFG